MPLDSSPALQQIHVPWPTLLLYGRFPYWFNHAYDEKFVDEEWMKCYVIPLQPGCAAGREAPTFRSFLPTHLHHVLAQCRKSMKEEFSWRLWMQKIVLNFLTWPEYFFAISSLPLASLIKLLKSLLIRCPSWSKLNYDKCKIGLSDFLNLFVNVIIN